MNIERAERINRMEDRLSPEDIEALHTEGLISADIATRAVSGDREALRVAAEAALDHDRLDPWGEGWDCPNCGLHVTGRYSNAGSNCSLCRRGY